MSQSIVTWVTVVAVTLPNCGRSQYLQSITAMTSPSFGCVDFANSSANPGAHIFSRITCGGCSSSSCARSAQLDLLHLSLSDYYFPCIGQGLSAISSK